MIRLASKLKKDTSGDDGNNPNDGSQRASSAPAKSFLIRDRLLIKGIVSLFHLHHHLRFLNQFHFCVVKQKRLIV